MVAVGAPRAVEQRHVPQLARAGNAGVLAPRADQLDLGEPDVLPDDSRVRAQHPVVVTAVEAIGVRQADRRAGPQVALYPQQVEDGSGAGA